ncbi:transposable element Tcb2 transposase [Trichonephila clavipes]|nr:transposable element Tcb2 transposase [Trichonephila clavipes]
MNPIEHVWEALGRRVAGLQPPPQTLQELERALLEEWDRIPLLVINSLIDSLPQRYFFQDIGKHGFYDEYISGRGTGGKGKILQPPALVVSAATTHKTFGPTDLTNTYSVCTRRVFGGIGNRTQAFQSGVRSSNLKATQCPRRM